MQKKKYSVTTFERPPRPRQEAAPLQRPLNNVNLNINVYISTPNKRPPLLKGHFSGEKGVASQDRFHCKLFTYTRSIWSKRNLI